MSKPIEHNKRIEVRVSNTLLDALKRGAKEETITISEFIRVAIDSRLQALKIDSKEQ